MPDNLPARIGGLFPSRAARALERDAEQIHARATVAMLRDRAEIVRVRETTKAGVRAVHAISAEEVLLAPADPLTQARLRVVADAGALCIAGIVADAGDGV
jgi:hypothetical protein